MMRPPDYATASGAAVGCIVLTQGRRPAELAAALDSLAAQEGVEIGRGRGRQRVAARGTARPHASRSSEDRGIPAGRNAGVPAVGGELLFFLDDDARLAAP